MGRKNLTWEDVESVFSQGDTRYSIGDIDIVVDFFNSNALSLEEENISHIEVNDAMIQESYGKQKKQKAVAKQILKNKNYVFENYEYNLEYGVVDILAKNKENKIIAIECGPCRVKKAIDYFRIKEVEELWIVQVYFNHERLYIIKRGPNWNKRIKEFDDAWLKILKSITSPLDTFKD